VISRPSALAAAATLLLAVIPLARAADAAPMAAPAASAASSAPADEAAGTMVTVTGIKSPLEVPYQRAYDATKKVQAASSGLADLVFKLRDKEPVANPMHVSVEYGETSTPLTLDPSNGFVLVPDDAAAAQNAALVVNRQGHAVSVQVDLRPHPPAAPLSIADTARMIEAGRAARATLLPWYARIVTPTIKAVRVCSMDKSAQFALRGADGTEAPLAPIGANDVYGRPATCADMPDAPSGQQQASNTLVAPADSTYDFTGTFF
jgi:hypothetical protein